MSESQQQFSGSIPENYQRYLVPLKFEGYAQDVAELVAAAPCRAVLETAAGTGVLTRRLRAALDPGVRLVATDLHPAMLDVARQYADAGDIEYLSADALDLPFENEEFDAVVCQFGAMFFPEKVRGYSEALRVLASGGRFVLTVWDAMEHNHITRCVHESMMALLPEDPPNFFELPFGYHDRSVIEKELRQAGFTTIDIHVKQRVSRAPSARDAALGLAAGSPLAGQLLERNVFETGLAAAEQAIRDEFGDGAVEAPMQAIVVTAWRD